MPLLAQRLRQRLLHAFASLPVTYTTHHGPARGLRRRGGLGWMPAFVPRHTVFEVEERWLDTLDLEGQVVWDIGGDQGIMSLCFARKVGPAGRVLVIEPNPGSVRTIRSNLAVNHFTHCEVLHAACGEAEGEVVLSVPRYAPAWGTADPTLRNESLGPCDEFVVRTVTVDALVERGERPPDFIKIDTEGFETSVLKGAARTIATVRPRLYLENHGADDAQKVANARAIVELLAPHGYSMTHLESGTMLTPDTAEAAARGHVVADPMGPRSTAGAPH
ncbi:MAG TPA: FkbM family methyltransferase [Gemmatimonadales bacterium]